jgi:hypothetical protein
MSEILANKITPVTGTTVTLGDSGDTFTIPSGVTVANSGTATGFGADTSLSNLSATGESRVCQCWANFNGNSTPSIAQSYNLSSITDHGVGDYTLNFTSALANANYAVAGACSYSTGNGVNTGRYVSLYEGSSARMAAGSTRISTVYDYNSRQDFDMVTVMIFGD